MSCISSLRTRPRNHCEPAERSRCTRKTTSPTSLTLPIPAGLIITQWYECSAALSGTVIEPMIDLMYVLAAPLVAEAPDDASLHLGKLTLPRAGVLATSRLIQRMSSASLAGDEVAPLNASIRAVKDLILPQGAADPEPGSRPPTRGAEMSYEELMDTPPMKYKAAVEAIPDSSLQNLAWLFDPRMGSACTDEPLCRWMHFVLTLERK